MKKCVLVLLIATICFTAQAQKSIEIGSALGLSSYLGDLKQDAFDLSQNSIAASLFGKYNWNSRLSTRLSFSYGTIKGNDARSDRADLRKRNLNFRSRISEVALMGEYNLLHFGSHTLNKSNQKYYRFTPYVFAGVSLFRFNPMANYNGKWYNLQTLGTEGQHVDASGLDPYNLTQIAIPVGLGLKFQLEPNIVLSAEIGGRKTFTDYLDDVSGTYYNLTDIRIQSGSVASELAYRGDELTSGSASPANGGIRGNADNKDWYVISTISLSYKLFRKYGKFTPKL